MSAFRAARPIARATLARPAVAPRRPVARFYTEGPKPSASGPTPGANPPPNVSQVTGTTTMLKWSVAGIATVVGAFLLLDRGDKKAALGVGPDGANVVKGAKHKVGKQDVKAGSKADYQQVYNAIAGLLEKEDYDDGSMGPVFVRLAWHCSGGYNKEDGTGGSNGATMRFAPESDHGANAGLKVARDALEVVKEKFPWVTYSDIWTLAGVAAIQEMGGPSVPWRPGRADRTAEHCTPDGRLPDGDKGPKHLRDIFYRMGFNDQEIVALSGAHALGRCHTDRSGFSGPWTFAPTSFTNEYFRLLFDEKWRFKKWDGPIQYEDLSTKELMMLTTDMALVQDKSFRKFAEKYARDEQAFFGDFSKAFAKLLELGVPEQNFKEYEADHSGNPYVLKSTADQENSA